MSKDAEKILHSCLEMRGTGNFCVECVVPKKGNCQIMIHEILKAKDTSKLPTDDIRDVISESIKTVQLGNFKGCTDAQFRKWVRRIIQNKLSDYFRKKYKKKEYELDISTEEEYEFNIQNQSDSTQEYEFSRIENENDVCQILQYLEKKVSKGELERNDLDLVQACYDGFKEGLSQEEVAMKMSLKPNTFNQKLSRLRKKLQTEKKGFWGND